jgi:hypothetical protein
VIEPSHADALGWQNQLIAAFGSPSHDFINLAIRHLANAVHEKGQPCSSELLNAGLAIVDGIRPENEIEALLAVQMAAAHTLAMECLGRARRAENIPQLDANGNMSNKLLRTFTAQVEALSRIRRGGKQKVVVEHVHVHPGAQAAVGMFVQGDAGEPARGLLTDCSGAPEIVGVAEPDAVGRKGD